MRWRATIKVQWDDARYNGIESGCLIGKLKESSAGNEMAEWDKRQRAEEIEMCDMVKYCVCMQVAQVEINKWFL